MRAISRRIVVLGCISVLAAACGGDSGPGAEATTTEESATTTGVDATEPAAEGEAALNTGRVTIGDQTFEFTGTGDGFPLDSCSIFASENAVLATLPTSVDGSGAKLGIDLSSDGAEQSRVSVEDDADTIYWEAAAYALGGMVEDWQIEGRTVTGTAMFRDLITFSEDLVAGTFELSCP